MNQAELQVVGRRLPKVDAIGKATGRMRYADDIHLPRMLFARILRSDRPHARILNIDVSRARSLPGVFAVITGRDLPITFGFMPESQDEHALALNKVRFVGDAVAAVAAVDERTAEEAIRLIDVEYEDLPLILTLEDALAPAEGGARIHEYSEHDNVQVSHSYDFGPVEEGFKAADVIREDYFFYGESTHIAIEQHCSVAEATGDGRITLWSSTQAPQYVLLSASKVLQVPMDRLRVIATPEGGGFGGKVDPFGHEIIVCKLAMLTGRPVKITLSREEVFYCHRGRHSVLMRYRLGAKRDGTITALDCRAYLDGGAYGSTGSSTVITAGVLQPITYQVPAYRYQGLRVFTNKPPCGPKRGHGTPQVRFGFEVALDKLAVDLTLSPAEMRRGMLVKERTRTVNWQRITSCGLDECLNLVVEASGFERKWGKLPLGQGVGLACGSFSSGSGKAPGSSPLPYTSVRVDVNRRGGVTALCGEIDIGQGSDTVLATCVAEVLGLRPDDIRLITADTEITPYDRGSFGSRVTFMMGNAAIEAASVVRDVLFRAASEKFEVPAESFSVADGRIVSGEKSLSVAEAAALAEGRWGPTTATGSYNPPDLFSPYNSGSGRSPAHSFSACVVEIEADPETGIITVKKVWFAHDGGRAINPILVEGQVQGSIYMGLGEVLMEENTFRKQGLHRGPSLLDYKSPTALEIPPMEVFLVQSSDPEGPFGAKEVGQGPLLPIPPAVANAVYDALGVRVDEVPITPEKILRALERKSRGEEPRVGPTSVPETVFPPTIQVEPPPDAPTLAEVLGAVALSRSG